MENKKYHRVPEEWLKEKYNSAKKLSDEGGVGALFDDGELSIIEDIQQSFPSEEINKSEWVSVKDVQELWRFVEAQRKIIMDHRDEPTDNHLMAPVIRQAYTLMANTLADTMDEINNLIPPKPTHI